MDCSGKRSAATAFECRGCFSYKSDTHLKGGAPLRFAPQSMTGSDFRGGAANHLLLASVLLSQNKIRSSNTTERAKKINWK